MSAPARTFKVVMSERCFRFKPDALGPHAPRVPGVYEFVTFNAKMEPEVLFVGVSSPGTLYDALAGHLMGDRAPRSEDLFGAAKDVYFDYVASGDYQGEEDLRDIAASLILRHNPRFNRGKPSLATGRYGQVEVAEVG